MTLMKPITRRDIRPSAPSSVLASPLGGSYVTTHHSTSEAPFVPGTYVTSHRAAPATFGSYVTTEIQRPLSGGSYTYTG